MTNSNYAKYHDFLAQEVMIPFYEIRLAALKEITLGKLLERKNPYLFKAKNLEIPADLVRGAIDAFLSSQEETIFGNLLEGFALYVSELLYGGIKSHFKSIDLEFQRNDTYYIVGIKSGIKWGNSDQISQLRSSFVAAKNALREQGMTKEIVAVNGCTYGKDANHWKAHKEPDKGYYKYAGQEFWYFISEDDSLYQEIIKPIDEQARQKDADFKKAYNQKVNELTAHFSRAFMDDHNQIDWIKLVDHVSKRR